VAGAIARNAPLAVRETRRGVRELLALPLEEAYRRHPELVLHKSDGTHPTLIGTYLAASTVYAAVYGKSPVGNPYEYYGAIDSVTAKKLQQVAQDTVERFYRR